METIGWIGAICIAVWFLPQVWVVIKVGHTDLSPWSLCLGLIGGVCMVAYTLDVLGVGPLFYSFALNLICFSIVSWYKFRLK